MADDPTNVPKTAQKNYERDQRAKAKTGTWEDEAFAEKTAQLTDNDVTLQLQLEQQELKKKLASDREETAQLAQFLRAQRTATGEAIIAVGPTKPAAAAASSKGTSILGEPIAAPSIGAVRAANKKKAAVLPLVTATPVAQGSVKRVADDATQAVTTTTAPAAPHEGAPPKRRTLVAYK